jgi:peptide/nickel transport system ATP-binding protein
MWALKVEKLSLNYNLNKKEIVAVRDVSFSLEKGRTVGIFGETGSGKSSIGLAIMGLLPLNSSIIGGKIIYKGKDLLNLKEREINQIRGKEISLIMQGGRELFDPTLSIRQHLEEVLNARNRMTGEEAAVKILEFFEILMIEKDVLNAMPSELSEGTLQKILISMALMNKPEILIADEPTSNLDMINQYRVLREIRRFQASHDMGLIFITHDLSIIANMADDVLVMYGGEIVEKGDIYKVFLNPGHPYTKRLLAAFPTLDNYKKDLEFIPGNLPAGDDLPTGCIFHPRCVYCQEKCRKERPFLSKLADNHYVMCHFVNEIQQWSDNVV